MAIKITKKMITKAAKGANKDQRELMFRSIIGNLLWMAARYAHGRNTYAPGMVREAVATMKRMFPDWDPKRDETIKAPEEMLGFELKDDYLHDIFNPTV